MQGSKEIKVETINKEDVKIVRWKIGGIEGTKYE
jgi:hypothetical protein